MNMKNIDTYENKTVLVLGLGKSGINSAELLIKLGAKVVVNDKNTPENFDDVHHLEELGAKVITGSHPIELLDDIDLMVKNPGIPYSNVLVAEAMKQNIDIITEPELAFEISEAPFISVTGTNGKTTTTTLISMMLNQNRAKGHAYAAGNIGIPLSEVAQKATSDDQIVSELSSFQLMGITELHPKIAVLTNIYEAHLDYHGSREDYIKAKMNIVKNQTAEDYFVVNWDNEEWQKLSTMTNAKVIPFSRLKKSTEGVYVDNDKIYFKDEVVALLSDIKVPGDHNVENCLAAIAVAKIQGKSNEAIIEVLHNFSGVRHRTQFVRNVAQRKFYNDSKATNMEATQKALAGFSGPVVLLAGGLDRGVTFEKLEPSLKNVRTLIVFGETSELLAQAGKNAGVKTIIKTENAVTAVPIAFENSQAGDVILLSPACASWDQWPTFEVRGDKFIDAVEKLVKQMEDK